MKYAPKSVCERRNWKPKSTKILDRKSYDSTALGFLIMTFPQKGIDFDNHKNGKIN